jgi:predicted Rossmann-fold nucleotide-binding protein
LGLHQKQIIILNENKYFSSMLNWIDQSIKEGFIKDHDKNLFQVVDSIEDFKRLIQS